LPLFSESFMRTDAKIGIICLLVIAAGGVTYYAWPSHKTSGDQYGSLSTPAGTGGTGSTNGSTDATADKTGGDSLTITGPGAEKPTHSITGPSVALGDDLGSPAATAPAMPAGFPSTAPSTVHIEAPGTTPILNPPSETSLASGTPTTQPKPMIDPMAQNPTMPTTPTNSTPLVQPEMPGLSGGTPNMVTPGGTGTGAGTSYTIKTGDSFAKIAKATYGNAKPSTIKAIEAANPGVDASKLKVGHKLTLPSDIGGKSATSVPAVTDVPTMNITPGNVDLGTNSSITPPSATTKPAKAHPTSYTVKRGDTLRKIAKATLGAESKWKLLAKVNGIDDPDSIYAGEKLKIPAAK
jgi:nucleoid-associated protein YgaU